MTLPIAMTSEWELLLRVALACALGGAIGYEREVRHKPAGMRTHMLVGLGAAAFTVGSILISEELLNDGSPLVADQVRVAAAIVVGVGFLGAGAILRTGSRVEGLTTAAGIWVTAAVGILAGAGFYIVAVGSAALAVIVVVGLRIAERLVAHRSSSENT